MFSEPKRRLVYGLCISGASLIVIAAVLTLIGTIGAHPSSGWFWGFVGPAIGLYVLGPYLLLIALMYHIFYKKQIKDYRAFLGPKKERNAT